MSDARERLQKVANRAPSGEWEYRLAKGWNDDNYFTANDIAEVLRALAEVEAQRDAVQDIVRQIEWASCHESRSEGYCPLCMRPKSSTLGHMRSCPIPAVLSEQPK